MNELVHIGNSDICVKEYNGQRVVTFKDIDMVHGRPDGTARATFNRNKERFVLGEDYFVCETYEAKELFDTPLSDSKPGTRAMAHLPDSSAAAESSFRNMGKLEIPMGMVPLRNCW